MKTYEITVFDGRIGKFTVTGLQNVNQLIGALKFIADSDDLELCYVDVLIDGQRVVCSDIVVDNSSIIG